MDLRDQARAYLTRVGATDLLPMLGLAPDPAATPTLRPPPAPRTRRPTPADPAPRHRPPPTGTVPLYKPGEAATLLNVHPRTLARWAAAGRITAVRAISGHRYYRVGEVEHLARTRTAKRSEPERKAAA